MKKVMSLLLAVVLVFGCCAFGVSAQNGDDNVMVTAITWAGENQPKPGAQVEFSVHLTNRGSADLASGTVVKVDLYVNQEKVFTQNYDQGVAAGATVQVKFPKWTAVEGEHVLTAVLNDTVAERFNWQEHQHLTANIRVAKEALEVPEIAEKFGMTTLTFSDDFTTLDLVDKECTGAYGYKWYANMPYGSSDSEPTDYELTEEGIRLIRTVKDPGWAGWTLCTFDCQTGAGWAGYTHGYMEMRVRTPADRISGDRGKPSVWSLPPEKILSYPDANRYVEMDFLEFHEDEYYTTTLHDLSFTDENQKEYIHHYKNQNFQHMGMRDGEWHTMGFVWREGSIISYLDGKEYMTLSWQDNGTSYPQAVSMKGNTDGLDAFAIFDDQLTPIVINGNEGWPLEIDYIRVWEGDAEANLGEGVEAAQFVDQFLRDSDGQIALDVTFDNYEAFIDMESWVADFSDETKAELDRLAKREVGKTMAQVIADAKQFKTDLDAFVAAYATDDEGAVLSTETEEVCKVIVKGEAQWKNMSAELKEAVNNHVFLLSNGKSTYDDLLTAAREKVPASSENESELSIETWMIVVAAAVVVVAAVIVILVIRKKRKK